MVEGVLAVVRLVVAAASRRVNLSAGSGLSD